ncbi:MAG: iron uptake porin [Cyanobacteriota bacterium]
MSKLLWQILKTTPAVLGASVVVAGNAIAASTPATDAANNQASSSLNEVNLTSTSLDSLLAQSLPTSDLEVNPSNNSVLESINNYNEISSGLDQVTSVSQLRDVSPGDWAYEALRNLVNRYNCIEGYPDRTYRGNRALTRYEFAAGLNSCLNTIERLIAASTADFVTREDLTTLERLIQEFEAELATIGTRVDALEGRVSFLEENQFSTTTKLSGEVIFALVDAFGDELADQTDLPDEDLEVNTTLSDRVRLNLSTSFTGRDLLRTRLQARNVPNLANVTGTDMARLGFDGEGGNNVDVSKLFYRFPLNDRITLQIGATGTDADDIASVVNPLFDSSGTGSLTRFFRKNPAVYRLDGNQSLGANIQLSDSFSLDLGYLTNNGNDPSQKNGLFDGHYSALAQLNLGLGERLDLALTYARSYAPGEEVNLSGSTSSSLAKEPFPLEATSANRYGAQANFRLAERISIGGWIGYVDAKSEETGVDADIWNWAANVAFRDFGKEGAVLGLLGGMPPKVFESDRAEDPDTSYMIEAQYRYPLTDNILLTPGAYVIFNPNHNDTNDTIYVGVLRTTFKF